MTAKEYLEKTYVNSGEYRPPRKAVMCKDGFFISIQGGTDTHYCQPREYCNYYYELELGFPSQKDELIMQWAEDPKNPTQTVYGYVPIEAVEQLIEKHGGIVAVVIPMWQYLKSEVKP